MTIRECVVNRLRELCKQRGLSMNGLANLCGMPPTTIKNIFSGVSQNPGIVTLKMICDGLGITIDEFFDTDEFRNLEQEIY